MTVKKTPSKSAPKKTSTVARKPKAAAKAPARKSSPTKPAATSSSFAKKKSSPIQATSTPGKASVKRSLAPKASAAPKNAAQAPAPKAPDEAPKRAPVLNAKQASSSKPKGLEPTAQPSQQSTAPEAPAQSPGAAKERKIDKELVKDATGAIATAALQDVEVPGKGGEALEHLKRGELAKAANKGLEFGLDQAEIAAKGLDHPDVKEGFNKAVDTMIDAATEGWPDHDKQALRRTMDTLDELAGGDGRLNHGDKMAIISALTSDSQGLIKQAFQQIDKMLPRQGPINQIAKRVVSNSFQNTRHFQRTGHRGLIQRGRDRRRGKIQQVAAQEINSQFNQIFNQLKVDPKTAQKIDGARRDLTIDQMLQMSRDVGALQRKFAGNGGGGNGELRQLFGNLQERFGDHIQIVAPPLRNGIPSPRDPKALVDTAIDAGRSVRFVEPNE